MDRVLKRKHEWNEHINDAICEMLKEEEIIKGLVGRRRKNRKIIKSWTSKKNKINKTTPATRALSLSEAN